MTKKILCLISLLILMTFFPTGAGAEEVKLLTLEEAIDIALANNNQVKIDRLSIAKAKLKLEQDKFAARKIPEEFVRNYETAMAKYILPMVSQMELILAEAKVELNQKLLKFQVENNYYELLKKKAALDNAQNALTRAREQLRLAQESVKAGVLAKSEIIGAEVLVASKEAELVRAQNDFDKAAMDLAQTLGLELDTKIVPTTEFSFEPVAIDLKAEIEKVLEKDVAILGAKEGLKVAEATFEQAKGYYTPNVFMYREAEHALEEAKAGLKKAQDEAELKVRKAYLDLLSAEKGYQTIEKSLELARENYRVAKLRFEAGLATRLEMEQAADSLSQQEATVMETLYYYNLAAAQFKYGLFK